MPDLFKEVMPSLMHYKNEVFENDAEKEQYFNDKSFMINRILSMYNDCVLYANIMNYYYGLDGKLKNDYYINTLRGYRRSYNYIKALKFEDLDIIKEYYGVNSTKAKEYHSLLTATQLDEIRKRLEKGGVK